MNSSKDGSERVGGVRYLSAPPVCVRDEMPQRENICKQLITHNSGVASFYWRVLESDNHIKRFFMPQYESPNICSDD